MKALLIYPRCPETFWSFKHALRFISKKAVHPPLGLLTVASMLPESWELKLVDMNVSKLRAKDIAWAEIVFISAMIVQEESVREIIERCAGAGVKVVCGGPLFTADPERFKEVDHLVLGEAELSLPPFVSDLLAGHPLRPTYQSGGGFPRLDATPVPRWDLLKMSRYVSMTIQYSRGCPFDCEFCDITVLYGRKVRTKGAEQVLAELDSLYRSGWRGGVFFADDNFIGNRSKLKREVLPKIVDWMNERRRPFSFSTEVSIDIADDDELMAMMVEAGFDTVFIGIETPDERGLQECNKRQNRGRNLLSCVQHVQDSGMRVRAGFIVGFDSDSTTTFKGLVEFIQASSIVTAMVGLLNAPRGTRLYERLESQGRLLNEPSGDNTDLSTNIVPTMGSEDLESGYRQIIRGIYAPKPYYERVKNFLACYTPVPHRSWRFHIGHIRFHLGYPLAIVKSLFKIGLLDRARVHFWKLFLWSLFKRPRLVPMALTYAIYGFHFRKVFANCLS